MQVEPSVRMYRFLLFIVGLQLCRWVWRNKSRRNESDGQLWNACPSWSQWTSASSLRFWKTPSEFRFRACPCDCSQLARPGSRIFQSDRSTGHCLQVKLPLEENVFLWEGVFLCLSVLFVSCLFGP